MPHGGREWKPLAKDSVCGAALHWATVDRFTLLPPIDVAFYEVIGLGPHVGIRLDQTRRDFTSSVPSTRRHIEGADFRFLGSNAVIGNVHDGRLQSRCRFRGETKPLHCLGIAQDLLFEVNFPFWNHLCLNLPMMISAGENQILESVVRAVAVNVMNLDLGGKNWCIAPGALTLGFDQNLAFEALGERLSLRLLRDCHRRNLSEVAVRREKAGMTQRDLAAVLGREHGMVARIELDERRVDTVEVYQLFTALGVDPNKEAAALMEKFETTVASVNSK